MTVLDTISAYLASKGFSRAQAAGIAGNFKIESGFNPAAHNAGENAIGLAQWEGPRRPALQAFARARGTSETDLNTQLDFMMHEFQTSERSAFAALVATDTAGEAAAVFDQKYERSAGTSRQQRIAAANSIYNTGDAGDGGVWKGTLEQVGFADRLGAAVEAINPFDNWADDALGIGIKLVGSVGAIALVVVGVMHTVKDGQD